MDSILAEITEERKYQISKWGGPEKDAFNNTPSDFVLYIVKYCSDWFKGGLPPHNTEDFRKSMIKVATLALAAIEAHDYAKETTNEQD